MFVFLLSKENRNGENAYLALRNDQGLLRSCPATSRYLNSSKQITCCLSHSDKSRFYVYLKIKHMPEHLKSRTMQNIETFYQVKK